MKIITRLLNQYHASRLYKKRLLKRWDNESNPHKRKEKAIIDYCDSSHYNTFIETGTYMGEMVYSLRNYFKTLYTIELSRDLYEIAKNHFREFGHIKFLQGDSGIVLGKIIDKLNEPSILWLDGHYSGGITEKGESETPIMKELQSIFSSPYSHIILIDDARCFGNSDFPDYPSIEALKDFIKTHRPSCSIEIKDDIIRIVL